MLKIKLPKAMAAVSLAAALAVSMFAAAPALAAPTPGYTIANTTGETLGNPPFTLGFRFSTSSAITISALGLFDSDQDGLAERHEIGIWNSGGTLLASTILGAGTVETLVNQFRYGSIASLALAAGTYQIGALYSTGADALLFPGTASGFATALDVTFLNSASAKGGALMNPGTAGTDPAYFGPNFLFDASAVPEPAGLLLVGTALAALGWTRRKNAPVSPSHG